MTLEITYLLDMGIPHIYLIWCMLFLPVIKQHNIVEKETYFYIYFYYKKFWKWINNWKYLKPFKKYV